MLAPDVCVEGFTAADWSLALELIRPPRNAFPMPAGRAGVVAVVLDRGRPVKALGPGLQRLDPTSLGWPRSLRELADEHGASWAVSADRHALVEAAERFAARLDPQDDYLSQGLRLFRIFRELEGEGEVETWPFRLQVLPPLEPTVVWRTLDLFCPIGQCVVFGAFEGTRLATCVVLRRGLRGIDRIVGPEAVRRPMGLLSGDWSRDYRHLVDVVEARHGRPALGVFASVRTFRELTASTEPGSWSTAVAARDVVVSPVAPVLAVPLGLDAGLAVARRVGEVSERLGVARWLSETGPLAPAYQLVRSQIPRLDLELEARLGFEPVSLLRRLLSSEE